MSNPKPDKCKEFVCAECGKTFSKSSSFYNHRKQTHNFRPTKENERGRPIKSESKPFERKLEDILTIERKIMQDRDFPELAKVLLKIVRKEKELYEKVFETLEKFDKDFQGFLKGTGLLEEKNLPGLDFLRNDLTDPFKKLCRTLLENWRLTLKLTDVFCKEVVIMMGFYVEYVNEGKDFICRKIKEEAGNYLGITLKQKLNWVCGGDFIASFVDILFSWKKNYKL